MNISTLTFLTIFGEDFFEICPYFTKFFTQKSEQKNEHIWLKQFHWYFLRMGSEEKTEGEWGEKRGQVRGHNLVTEEKADGNEGKQTWNEGQQCANEGNTVLCGMRGKPKGIEGTTGGFWGGQPKRSEGGQQNGNEGTKER